MSSRQVIPKEIQPLGSASTQEHLRLQHSELLRQQHPTTTQRVEAEPTDFHLESAMDGFLESFELEADIIEPTETSDQIAFFLPEPEASLSGQMELNGMSRPVHNVLVEGKDQAVEFFNSPSLLDSMEQQGLQVPYQCREGYCGACRSHLINGKVAYLKEPIAWLNDGEVLPCCCVPTTDIHIKING